ncbi:MAG TPA: NADPH-dependent F420 reductase [Acidimicrobiales bacterium]|nr:NADPH-dependent F420 reductase [Acidimicrobiales bacterium]
MRIGMIGAGNIGSTLAWHFVRVGHDVAVSNSRGPETLDALVRELGEHAQAMAAADAARFGEITVVSVPFGKYRTIPVDGSSGKVVIDTNNYYPGRDGQFSELDDDRTTSSEMLAAFLPQARLVKAFNAIYWEHLRDGSRLAGAPDRIAIPISGDDAEAKRLVAILIDEIGFDAVDLGSLAVGGRKHQPGSPLYTADLSAVELRRLASS